MRRLLTALAIALAAALWAPAAAQADFGAELFDVSFENADHTEATQAGSHPFAMNTRLIFDHDFDSSTGTYTVDEDLKDIFATQLAGFAGDATAYPRCSTADFLTDPAKHDSLYSETGCDEARTAVGIVLSGVKGFLFYTPLLNLTPPPGVPARLGFSPAGVKVILDVGVKQGGDYNIVAKQTNVPQIFPVIGAKVQLWGVPADPAHDPIRGRCGASFGSNTTGTVPDIEFEHSGIAEAESCPSGNPLRPFLTLPTSCTGPAASSFAIDSWPHPAAFGANGEPDLSDPLWASGSALTHDFSEPPLPQGFVGCGKLAFNPSIAAQPTSKAASSPTGLDFSLDVSNPGLTSAEGLSGAAIEKAVVTLPEGMSVNPSQAEGLEVCSEADLGRETLAAQPGEGCPQASKIGTVEIETPLLEGALPGSLYIAKPYENEAGDSLLALYIVIKDRANGILVKQPARVEPDPVTGQLTTTTEGMPQLPFSHFRLHFKEGTRSPLATPPTCGTHEVKALLYPYSGNPPVESTSAFQIITGPNEGPCPKGGLPPFHPGLIAGTINNRAGSFSPFNLRLFRSDSEQEITHFSIKLPPGIVGKLAGIPFCPDAQVAAAKARTGPHGGQEELEHPSCPAASEVGRTLVGAGVGPSLTYVPGKVYLAGPYHGSALSMVAITAGVAGPFDLGTVVVREALQINPETAEVFIDATGSDPIPHIIQGIPVHLRDIRAYVDKPNFVLNPTSCARTSTASTVLGSGLDFVSEADDNPFTATSPFQAADCASLGFKPKLALKLTGATKRGANPALRATLIPRPGDANSRSISVQLPHSEFLDQAHIRTVCTRVQFNAGAGNGAGCPAGSVYGHARAWTPLLSEPLEGPVFLRSSEHPLPDLVLAMHGLIDFNAVGRVDSVDGGIRNSFDFVPDAPVSKVVVDFEGGAKGLLENSTNLCKSKHRAIAKFQGHNGKAFNAKPVLKVKCKQAKKHKQAKAHKRHARAAR